MSTAFTTRPAQPGDIPDILHFIKELAIYEKEEDKGQATHAALFSSESGAGIGGHVAWDCRACLSTLLPSIQKPPSATETPPSATGRTPIGFALYFYNFSTWCHPRTPEPRRAIVGESTGAC